MQNCDLALAIYLFIKDKHVYLFYLYKDVCFVSVITYKLEKKKTQKA